MLRGIGWFISRHGAMDWIESNNEYWLAQDAWLRTMFNVKTGPGLEMMDSYKRKSAMKAVYAGAGIHSAPWQLATTLDEALAFAGRAGWPLVAKPDVGVGANDTFRLQDEQALRAFFGRLPLRPYLLEKYVDGEICSYDALIGSRGQPLYETGNITRVSVMDVVNEKTESIYMIVPQLAKDLAALGRRAVSAFGVKSRLVHFEFFRLNSDQEGLGKKGDLLGLEVNMRPSGGFTPDMINYAGSVDIHGAVRPSHMPYLAFLPSGPPLADPAPSFRSDKFEGFLRIARARFDYVILDTPPVSRYVDCLVIGPRVDHVILVVRAHRTKKQIVVHAKEQIAKHGGRIMGVVLNRRRFFIPEFIYKRL